MSILTKPFERLISAAIKRELEKVPDWAGQVADAQQWDIPDPVIFANQADLYRVSPILGTALDVLAGDIGTAQFNVKRMVGEEERDIPNHPLEVLLRNPNPLESGLEFASYTVSNYELNGNAIWWQNKPSRSAPPDELWTIPYEMIKPVPDEKLYLSHYNLYPGNGKPPIRLETWEVVHFKNYNPHNRFWGLSKIESLVDTIQGDLGMRRTNRTMYVEHGGSPPDILAFKDWVNDDAWSDIKQEKKRAAISQSTLMLRGVGDTVTWMSRALSSKDAEYVAILKQNMVDVFNRMCPGLLSMLSENATEANALAARATYAEKTLWVMMETIAQKVTGDILPAYGRRLKGEFNDPRVVDRKLELDEQGAYERTHTIAEVRKEKYGDDPLGDERDKLLVSEIKVKASPFGNQPQQDNQPPAENAPQQDTGQDATAKAAIDDLQRWRKMALRGKVDKAAAFVSDVIPAGMMDAIKIDLAETNEKGEIAGIFDDAIEQLKPKPQIDTLSLLEGIRQGVKALELSK